MSDPILTTLEADAEDVGSFLRKLFTDFEEALAIFETLSPEMKAVAVPLVQGAILAVKAFAAAGEAEGVNVTLDVAAITAITALIRAAEAGEKTTVEDFKALGIRL